MNFKSKNSFASLDKLEVSGKSYHFYNLSMAEKNGLKDIKKLPKYTFYKKTGPQHKPIFKTDVQIPNSKKVIGSGTSKKNAQQNAASKLLRSLKIL